jgi:YidC/Oxa1 family membrane protein insertase
MKKIQARYKDDKQRQQQAMMEFYREHQVNPLGSCLPLLLQFPFFIGLYQTLRSDEFQTRVAEHGGGQFLFIPDITKPLTGHTTELVVMIVLYVGTQLLSSYVSSFNVQDKNQKRLLFLFPFLFVPVVIHFEAGLLVYWITTNVWTIGQQLFVRKFLPPPEPHVAGATAGSGGGGGKAEAPAGMRAAVSKAFGGGGGGGGGGGDNGGKATPAPAKRSRSSSSKPATAVSKGSGKGGSGGNASADGGPRKAPPPSPRKKKKRSGRRR